MHLKRRRIRLGCAFLFCGIKCQHRREGHIPLAVQWAAGRSGPVDPAMDCAARAGPDLLLRICFSPLSNPRPDGACRHSSRRQIPGSRCAVVWTLDALVVRPHSAVGRQRLARPHGDVLGGLGRLAVADRQRLASGHAADLLCLFSFLRQRRRRISPATNPTACFWKQGSWRCSLLRPAGGRGWVLTIRLHGPACSCCSGSGSAFTSNRAW